MISGKSSSELIRTQVSSQRVQRQRPTISDILTRLHFPSHTASPLSLTASNNGPQASHPVLLVIDSALSNASKIAFHAQSPTSSHIISSTGFTKFVESQSLEVQHIDFVELKTKQPAPSAKQPNASKPQVAPAPATSSSKQAAKIEDAELIGITVRKDGDFPEWYQQVLRKGDMLDYYDVSGCYILKPWSYAVWEAIQSEYKTHRSDFEHTADIIFSPPLPLRVL